MTLSIAILAGGESRRMGRDKGGVLVDGVPMLARVVGASIATGLPVVVVGRVDVAALGDHRDVPRLADDAPGNGPLGGIATALRATGGAILAVACDMPFITAGALRWLGGHAGDATGRDGVVVTSGGRREPLFSAYAVTSLPLIEAHLARGERALHALISAGDFLHIEVPPAHAMALANINTPEELGRVEDRGSRIDGEEM